MKELLLAVILASNSPTFAETNPKDVNFATNFFSDNNALSYVIAPENLCRSSALKR